MAININRVNVSGNLTKDPDLRVTRNNNQVVSMRVAINDRAKDSYGEWVDRANYFNVTAWGALAEQCERNLSKGDPIVVDGRLRWREWQPENGPKREIVEIVATTVVFVNMLGQGGGSRFHPADDTDFDPPPPERTDTEQTDAAATPDVPPDTGEFVPASAGTVDDSDIPFARQPVPDLEFGPQRRRDLFVGDR